MPDLANNPAQDAIERRKGIGGSDVAVLLGLSPYKTPLDLWMEKRGLWVDEFAGEAAAWGAIMEPIIIGEYARREHCPVLHRSVHGEIVPSGPVPPSISVDFMAAAFLLDTLVHPRHPWARGHIDGVALTAAGGKPSHIVEAKTADLRLEGHWGDEGTDEVPEYYLVQVMWYLWLADLDLAHLAVLIGGNRFRRYRIERDNALIDVMAEHAASFWSRVENEDPPDPEPGERGAQSLTRLYPRGATGKEIDASPEVLEIVRGLHAARVAKKAAEIEEESAKTTIKAVLADAVRLNLAPKSYVSWTNNKDTKEVDWQAVARHLLDEFGGEGETIFNTAVAAHTTIKPGPRVFRCQGLDKLFD